MAYPDKALQINDEPLDQSRTLQPGEEAIDGDGRFVATIIRESRDPIVTDVYPDGTIWINQTPKTWFLSSGAGLWSGPSSSYPSIIVYEDFFTDAYIANGSTTEWQFSNSNGARTLDPTLGSGPNQGIIKIDVNSGNVNNYAAIGYTKINALAAIGNLNQQIILQVPTLFDATNNMVLRCGLGDIYTSNADQNNGAYFEYNFSTSNNWVLRVADAGVRQSTISSTVVGTSAYLKFNVRFNAAASTVEYLIDNVVVGSFSSGLPTGRFGPFVQLRRNGAAGNATRSVYVDQMLTSLPGR